MSKWTETSFTRRLGVAYPIIQGPFGRGSSSVRLAAAVSNAGGLASFGANDLAPEDVLKNAIEIRKHTEKPFSLNLWVSNFDDRGADLLNSAGVATLKRMSAIVR